MVICQLHDPQCPYSQHLHFGYHAMHPKLYCQGSIPPGITYVGMTPTMEHNQLYPEVFQQPLYNIHHGRSIRKTNNFQWSQDKQEGSRSLKKDLY